MLIIIMPCAFTTSAITRFYRLQDSFLMLRFLRFSRLFGCLAFVLRSVHQCCALYRLIMGLEGTRHPEIRNAMIIVVQHSSCNMLQFHPTYINIVFILVSLGNSSIPVTTCVVYRYTWLHLRALDFGFCILNFILYRTRKSPHPVHATTDRR